MLIYEEMIVLVVLLKLMAAFYIPIAISSIYFIFYLASTFTPIEVRAV